MTARRRLCEGALTLGAILGVACLISLLATVAFGVRPLIVRSGSMAPGIPTGALALARETPAADIEVGDVISVTLPSGVRVTHRVVESVDTGGRHSLTLKGDANRTSDAAPYVVTKVDKVFFDVSRVGYVVSWMSGPGGRFAGGALVGVLLLVAFGHREPRPQRGKHFARSAAALVVVLAGVATGPGRAEPTLAAFNDSGTASSGSLAAHTVPAPALVSCNVTGNVLSGFTATITWTNVTAPHALTYTARIVQNNTNLTINGSGTTRNVQVTTGLLGSLLGSTVTIEIIGRPTAAMAWSSVPTNKSLAVGALGLSLTCV